MVRKLHLYTALILGVLFSLIGLSGSWLVFYPEIDSVLLEVDTRAARPEPIRWQRALEASDAALKPGPGMTMLQLHFGETGPVLLSSQMGPDMFSTDYAQAYVDSVEGRVLAQRDVLSMDQPLRESLTGIALALHTALVVGPTGYLIIAFLGVWLLCVLVTGAWMWWPRGSWRSSAFLIKSRPGKRAFLGDLHRITGVYSFLFLLFLTLTGVYFGLRPYVNAALSRVVQITPPPQMSHAPTAHAGDHAASLDEIVAKARERFPARRVQSVMLMRGAGTMYVVSLAPRDGGTHPVGSTDVYLDSGANVQAVRDPAAETPADGVLRWLRPLHTGHAFGIPGRIVAFIMGLLPTAFMITGVWIWLRRRRQSQRTVAHSAA
jgi:uncharacterized iron-regulated membrane protein